MPLSSASAGHGVAMVAVAVASGSRCGVIWLDSLDGEVVVEVGALHCTALCARL